MTETITLAHLSDVHLAPIRGFGLRHLNIKRGLGYLNWQRSRRRVHLRPSLDLVVADLLAQKPDHVAVTGDLINLGLPAEYDAAQAWLQSLGTPDHVSVVPGNHDIYTSLRGHPGVERWADYMRSDEWGDQFADEQPGGFPYVRRLGPVALVGLNSAEPTPPFVAAGRLGHWQIESLARVLKRLADTGLVRVVLIHHPPLPGQAPTRRALRDASALERVLVEHGAELVLHGHNHVDMHHNISWLHGGIPVIGVASGSSGRLHKREPLARYNLLHISRTGNRADIECVTRGLDSSTGTVETLERKLIAPHVPAPVT